MEQMVLSASNREPFTVSQHFRDLYQGDFDMGRLDTHLKMLSDIIQRYGDIFRITIEESDKYPHSLPSHEGNTRCYSTLLRNTQVSKFVPYNTSDHLNCRENIFSSAEDKDLPRSSMTQERLNHLLLLHCHKERTDQLDFQQLAKTFVEANERRRHFFGTL